MAQHTRQMTALREFSHEGRLLRAGDHFFATDIDAGYLERCGRARDEGPIPASLQPVVTTPPPATPTSPPPPAPAAATDLVLRTLDAAAVAGVPAGEATLPAGQAAAVDGATLVVGTTTGAQTPPINVDTANPGAEAPAAGTPGADGGSADAGGAPGTETNATPTRRGPGRPSKAEVEARRAAAAAAGVATTPGK